MQTCKPI